MPRRFAALTLLFAVLPAVARSAQAQRAIVIRDVTVIAGDSSRARPRMDVRIIAGQIERIIPTGQQGAATDSVIDARGLFAIPGLIDAHVHVTGGPLDASRNNLRAALRGGVTSVLDMAGNAQDAATLAREVEAGTLAGPSIWYPALFAGPVFMAGDARVRAASGTHAVGTAPWARTITDTTNIAEAVRAAKATGATWLKLYADLDSAAIARIVPEAHRHGLRVVAHAATFPGIPSDLVAARADMLAHSPYLVWEGSPRTRDYPARARGDFRNVLPAGAVMSSLFLRMVRGGTALNTTLFVFDAQRDSAAQYRTPWMNAATERARAVGVRIVAGTDGLYNASRDSLPGIHRELELLVSGAKFTPLEALTAATVNGAWAVGSPTRGLLAEGKTADLVLLAADPLADIRNTRAIRLVMKSGKVVER
jgi:imidazolonepropionase-like amidohydrolase